MAEPSCRRAPVRFSSGGKRIGGTDRAAPSCGPAAWPSKPLEQRTLLAALPTLTALSVSASSVTSGQPVTFTAHVSVPSSASVLPSGGTVTFTDGTTVLGTAPLVDGTASLVNSLFAVGTHSVRASYSGNGAEFAGSAAAAASPSITVAPVGSGGPSGYAMPMYASASALGQDGGVSPMSTAAPTGMTPTQIRQAYGFNALSFGSTAANGAGTTIAIVDAYDDPNIASDLQRLRRSISACPTRRPSPRSTRRAAAPLRPPTTAGPPRSPWTWSGPMPSLPGPTSCWWRPTAIPIAT